MHIGSSIALFWTICVIALMGGHTLYLIRKGRFLLFDPLNTFWAGIMAAYVMQALNSGVYYSVNHSPGTLNWTMFWLFFGLVFIIWGYESNLGIKCHRIIPNLPAQLDRRKIWWGVVIGIGLGILGYAISIIGAGGLMGWAAESRGARVELPLGLAQMTRLVMLLPVAIPMYLMYTYMFDVSHGRRIFAWVLNVLFLMFIMYQGSRSRTIGIIVGMLTAYYLPRRRNPPLRVLVPVGLILIVVIPFLAMYRSQFTDFSFHLDQIDWSEASKAVLPSWLSGSTTQGVIIQPTLSPGSELNCVMASIDLVPNQVDFNYGYAELELITHFIPRKLWPNGKAYPHYEAFSPIYEKGHLSNMWVEYGRKPFLAGPAFGWLGHWWAVGGPLALIIAGILTGAMLRAMRHFWDRSGGGQGDMLYLLTLTPLGFTQAAATPMFFLFYSTPSLILFFIVIRYARNKHQLTPYSYYPQLQT